MKSLRTPKSDDALTLASEQGSRPVIALRSESNGARPPLRSHRVLQPVVLIGIVLATLAAVLAVGVYVSATKRQPVLAAARALPAGTLLSSSDLRTTRIAASADVLSTFAAPADVSAVLGHRLSAPVSAGAPLPRSALAPVAGGQSSFTLVVPFGHALGGNLHPGDRISVVATFGSDSGSAQSRALARNLVVLDVGRPASVGDPNTAVIPVTVALPDPALATQLALANSTAKIDLLLEPAAGSSAPIPSARAGGGS
ncbi:MAG: Flp pilus assembly protein RcpC/CpaB [Gaiellaceae bacterium]|jgi:Flp pilus assembly protein CpaB|nr:Flp pilus assembly protein RcpC/CpaB [Gaiellaceae bacterium]